MLNLLNVRQQQSMFLREDTLNRNRPWNEEKEPGDDWRRR